MSSQRSDFDGKLTSDADTMLRTVATTAERKTGLSKSGWEGLQMKSEYHWASVVLKNLLGASHELQSNLVRNKLPWVVVSKFCLVSDQPNTIYGRKLQGRVSKTVVAGADLPVFDTRKVMSFTITR